MLKIEEQYLDRHSQAGWHVRKVVAWTYSVQFQRWLEYQDN